MFDGIRFNIIIGYLLLPLAVEANGLDIYYNLDIYFHPSTNQSSGFIEGINHVRVINNTGNELKELYFHNASNYNSKNEILTEISTIRCSHTGIVNGKDSLVMKIGLFPHLQPGETVLIDISFKTYLTSSNNPELPTFGTRIDTSIYNAVYFYPVLEFYYADSWKPDLYKKSIKPHTNFAKYDIDLNVPIDFLVSTSGKVTKQSLLETGHYKYTIKDDHTLLFSAVFVQGMQKHTLEIGGIQIEIIAQKKQLKLIKKIEERLKSLITFYENQFGNSLMDKLVITSGYFIGSRAVTTSNYIIFQDNIDVEHVLDHELAHQWFGNSVQTDEYTESWLNESFAEYASWLYDQTQREKPDPFTFNEPLTDLNIWSDLKALNTEDWARLLMDVIDEKSLPPVYRPGKQIQWEKAANIYSKYISGNHALQMLQASVGDSIMQKIMYDYCVMYKGRTASTDDFIQIINLHTTKKIADNFRLALTTNLKLDVEILDVKSNYKEDKKWENKIITSFLGSWPMPVDVLFITEYGDSILLKHVDISANSIIKLNTTSPVKSAELDPYNKLFDDNRFNNGWPRRISLQPNYGLPRWETYKVYYRPRIKKDWRGNWRTGVKLSGGLGINMLPIFPAFYQNLFDLEITFSTGVPSQNWGGRINYRTPLESTANTYWELETGYEHPKKWTKVSFNNFLGEPKYLTSHGRSYYSRLTTTFSSTEYTESDSGDWWIAGKSMKLKEKWTIFSYTAEQRYLLEAILLGGFQEEETFYTIGLSADFETHKIDRFVIRMHNEAGFVWDERKSNEFDYRLLYIPKVWQQREGRIPLFRGVSTNEKEWHNNIISGGISIGWETKAAAWPMVYMDVAKLSNYNGTFIKRIEHLKKSNTVFLAAGIGLESQTIMEVGIYFPIWVSHPASGEDNFALRMLLQWGFYF